MPYDGANQIISLYVKPTAIDDLLQKLTPELLDDIFNGKYFVGVEDVFIQFPKFSFEKSADLIPVCSANLQIKNSLPRLF